MSALVFVDSNVLIYSVDAGDPRKRDAARAWIAELWNSRRGRISFQALQKFYWIAGKKVPEAREQIRMEIRDLLAWKPVAIDGAVLEIGWRLQDRYQLSFWDALIVAAAKAAGCAYLLTEDLQAGQELDGIVVVNPFATEPSALSG